MRIGSNDRAIWLVLLFLLAGVVAPAGAVLWFVNQAARGEAEEARREVADAYAGQLRLLRDLVDQAWKDRSAALAEAGGFRQVVEGGLAESAILLNADGTLRYPPPRKPVASDATLDRPDWRFARSMEAARVWNQAAERYAAIARAGGDADTYARAVQAEVRCLVLAGEKDRALTRISEAFYSGSGYAAVDAQGRRYAADALLLAASLPGPGDRRRLAALERLTRLLNSADGETIPAAQRLFVMTEAQTLGAKPFPTYEAERLAARFLEADQPRVAGVGLQATNLPGVWKLASPDGRIIALLSTESVIAATNVALGHAGSDGVAFTAVQPGAASGEGAVAAGPMLPGWQLSFSVFDSRHAEAESARRRNAYLWTGYLVIASMALTGLLLGRSFGKRMQLARMKTDMLAAVAHELKTPLASTRLLVDSLLENERFDAERTREYLTLISGENERLTRLVENFLTFSRIQRRRHRFHFRMAEPARIVEGAVAAVRQRFQDSCCLEVKLEPDLPLVEADPEALVTVLINLLENAYKYTPGEKRLSVRAYREAQRVVFAVADNGIGIPSREHRRIFRQFYQVDQALARESGGCGLGLSIVDHIVRAHRGQVLVASKPGAGSTFSVMVPVKAAG